MALVSKAFGDIITFTRASTGSYFDSAGVLQSAATNAPRLDYDPSTLAAQGLLIEEQRTNSIRNNTMVGAVAGTPGTLPTNWAITSVPAGVTRTIVGTGTESGITYIDIQFSGTPGANADVQIYPEAFAGVAAAPSQTWAESFYVKLAAGSTTNISAWRLNLLENTSAPAFLRQTLTNISAPSSSGLAAQRVFASATLGASTAFIQTSVVFALTSGAAINITLRIGLPQLEQGAFATSVIPTSTVAVTRSADVASVNTLSPWYNATEGTLYAEGGIPSNYNSGFATMYSLNDNTSNNSIQSAVNASGDVINVEMKVSGSVVAGFYPDYVSGTTKLAFAYKLNDVNYAKDGVAGTTDTSATIPVVTQLNLGANQAPTNFFNGYLRRITYYPRRLTNAELVSITT